MSTAPSALSRSPQMKMTNGLSGHAVHLPTPRPLPLGDPGLPSTPPLAALPSPSTPGSSSLPSLCVLPGFWADVRRLLQPPAGQARPCCRWSRGQHLQLGDQGAVLTGTGALREELTSRVKLSVGNTPIFPGARGSWPCGVMGSAEGQSQPALPQA